MPELAADSFDRADNADLGSDWTEQPGTEVDGSFQILSNHACPSAINLIVGEYYTGGITWPNNQYAEVVCNGLPATSRGGGPNVRCSTSVGTWYGVQARNNSLILYKVVADVFTTLASSSPTLADTDTVRTEANGTTVRTLVNGAEQLTASDSAIVSGNPGIRMYLPNSGVVSDGRFASWSAGSLVNMPVNYHQLQEQGIA